MLMVILVSIVQLSTNFEDVFVSICRTCLPCYLAGTVCCIFSGWCLVGTGCGSCYCLTGCRFVRSADLRNIDWSIFEVDWQLIIFGLYNFFVIFVDLDKHWYVSHITFLALVCCLCTEWPFQVAVSSAHLRHIRLIIFVDLDRYRYVSYITFWPWCSKFIWL